MSKILVGKVKVNNNLVYTEEIINLLMLGNSSRHQLYVDSLESGPITFRRTENIYSAQFQDHHWKINKKETKPQKLYVIDEDTVLNCGDIQVTFQKIKEDQLEVVKDTTPMTRRQNISDLLAESKEAEVENLEPAAKSFLSKIKSTLSKKTPTPPAKSKLPAKTKKLKKTKLDKPSSESSDETKANILINLPSILLQFSLTYFTFLKFEAITNTLKISHQINNLRVTLNKNLVTHLPLDKFQGVLNTITSKLPLKMDSSSIDIINTSIVEIIGEVLFFLIIMTTLKIIQSLLFGGQISYLISGISINGSGISKRIKSIGRELLSLILFPLNVFNPFGLIPLKSLPDFICRVRLVRKSIFRIIMGGTINVAISITLLASPFILNKHYEEGSATIGKTKSPQKPDLRPISFQVLNNNSIELMLPSEYSIESKEIKNKIPIINLSTGNAKATFSSLHISSRDDLNIEKTYLHKYPLSILFFPALYFANKIKDNDLFYQSTRKKRNIERQKILFSTLILTKDIDSLIRFFKTNGPFLWGASNLRIKLKKSLPLLNDYKIFEGDIDSTPSVILQSGSTLYFFQFNDDENILFSIEFEKTNDMENTLANIFDPEKDGQGSDKPHVNSIPVEGSDSVIGIPEDLTKDAMEKIEKLKKSLSL